MEKEKDSYFQIYLIVSVGLLSGILFSLLVLTSGFDPPSTIFITVSILLSLISAGLFTLTNIHPGHALVTYLIIHLITMTLAVALEFGIPNLFSPHSGPFNWALVLSAHYYCFYLPMYLLFALISKAISKKQRENESDIQ